MYSTSWTCLCFAAQWVVFRFFLTRHRSRETSPFFMEGMDHFPYDAASVIGDDSGLEIREESPFHFDSPDFRTVNTADLVHIDPVSPFDFGVGLPDVDLETNTPSKNIIVSNFLDRWDAGLENRPASPFLLGEPDAANEITDHGSDVQRNKPQLIASPEPDGCLSEEERQTHAFEIYWLRYGHLYDAPNYPHDIPHASQHLRDRVSAKQVDKKEMTFAAFEKALTAWWVNLELSDIMVGLFPFCNGHTLNISI